MIRSHFIVILWLFLSSCATSDTAVRAEENREMARAEAVDEFLKREARCNQLGKGMVIRRTGTRIRRGPTKEELGMAQC